MGIHDWIKDNITQDENGKVYLDEIRRRLKGRYPHENIGHAMKHCFSGLKIKAGRSKEQWTVCTRVYLGVCWRHHLLPVSTLEPNNTDSNEKSELPKSDAAKHLQNTDNGILLEAMQDHDYTSPVGGQSQLQDHHEFTIPVSSQFQDHDYSVPVSSQCTEGTDLASMGRKSSKSGIPKTAITGRKSSKNEIAKKEITGRKSSKSGIGKNAITGRKSSKSGITKKATTGRKRSKSGIAKKVEREFKEMGTNLDSTCSERLLEDVKIVCERLAEQGMESLVIIVDRDSHYLSGSQSGRDYLDDKNLLIEDFIQYCKDHRASNWMEKTPGNTVSNLNNLNDEAGSQETEFPKLPEVQEDLNLFDGDTVDYEEPQEIDMDVLDNMYKLVRTENNQVSEGVTNHDKSSEVAKENHRENTSDTERVEQNLNTSSEENTEINESNNVNDTTANSNDEDGETEIEHECKDCASSFKTGLELADHIGKEHERFPDEGSFPCRLCGFMFAYEAHLKEHNERNPKCLLDISVKKKKDFSALQYEIKVKDPKSGEMKKRKLKHILDISYVKLPLQCPFCQKSYEKLYAYQCHILLHSEIRLRRCHICLKQFNCHSSLPRHLTAHEERLYFCGTCYNRFENQARRDHHVSFSCKKTKHRPGLICSDCGYQTKSMSHLMLHKRKHTHVQCRCDVCGRFLKSMENLQRHLAKSHNIPFQCEICGKFFKHKDTLKRHNKEHGELRYKCEVCGKLWSELSKLNRHLKIHSGVKLFPFVCEICGEAFSRKTILDSHRLLHTGETPFKCDIEGCVKAFRSISALKQHKEYHVTFHPFMCDYCGRSFKRECLMRHHRKSHTEWQWPCDYCNEKFNSRKRFKSHLVSHHQDKVPEIVKKTKMTFFKCTVCNKILSQKTVFLDHMSMHNGVKPHKCKFCEKGFSAKSNLRQHEKTHTGGKKFHCNFCSRTYDDPKALEIHWNNKHKEKLDTPVEKTVAVVKNDTKVAVLKNDTKVAVVKNDTEAELQTATASLSLSIDRQININSGSHLDLLIQKPADLSLQLDVIQNQVPVSKEPHATEFQSLVVNDNFTQN